MIILYFLAMVLSLIAVFYSKKEIHIRKYIYVLLFVILTGVRVGYDTKNYITMFDNIKNGITDIYSASFYKSSQFFIALMKLIQYFHIDSFFVFKAIIIIIVALPALYIIGKYSANVGYLCFFYLIYSFSIDAIQLRNMISLLLLIVAFDYLYKTSKNSIYLYILLILLATINHTSFIIYFIYLILKLKDSTKLVNIFFILGCIFFVFTFLNGNVIPGLQILATLLNSQKLLNYLNIHTNLGFIYPTMIYFFNLALVAYCKINIWSSKEAVIIQNRTNRVDFNNMKLIKVVHNIDLKRLSKIIYNMNKLLVWSLPLCMISLSAFRVIRNLFIINLFLFASYSMKYEKNNFNKLVFNTLLLLLSIGTFYYLNFILGPRSDIIYAVLRGKLFFMN